MLPKHVQVQLATLVEAPPVGNEWVHEIKFDGYRMLSFVDGRTAGKLATIWIGPPDSLN